jgi:hypothetical protein
MRNVEKRDLDQGGYEILRRTSRRVGRIVLGLVVASTLAAGAGVATAAAAPGGPWGESAGQATGAGTGLETLPLADLSEEEIEGLLFMLEEEKLARDIYRTLYDLWGHATFANIARAEQMHMDAVRTLLERYDVEAPADDGVGEFTNSDLQELYDSLAAQGSESLVSALRVGALIEEIDILDLEAYIAKTDAADLIRVYENLLRGSQNHLRAFSAAVARQTGEAYEPQRMGEGAYEAATEGTPGFGGRGQRGAGNMPFEGDGGAARGNQAIRGSGNRGAGRNSAPFGGWGEGVCQ